MYLMDVLSDDDRLIATQRYYNLVKSIFEYHDKNYGPKCAVNLGDVTLSWGHSMKENTVMASFLLGEDEFFYDIDVEAVDGMRDGSYQVLIVEKDKVFGEFMEFVNDFYPEFV